MDIYKYKAPASTSAQNFKLLPEDDYDFEVTRCAEPYKNSKGNWVLPVRLSILPDRITVFDSVWSGTDKNGELHDTIAEFLLCVGHAPREGEEPDWDSIVGARGRCRLKVETAQRGKLAGQEINAVAWFIQPEAPMPTDQRANLSTQEYDKLRKDQQAAAQGGEELDNIPF
jgi:hypothetical protein